MAAAFSSTRNQLAETKSPEASERTYRKTDDQGAKQQM